MKKRIVSSIMCLAMLLTLLPVTAFAVEPPASNDNAAITVGYAKENTGVKDSATAVGVSDARATAMQTQVTSGTSQGKILWFLMTGLKAGNDYSLSMKNGTGKELLEPAAVNAGNTTGKFSIGTNETGNYFLYVSLDNEWQIGEVAAGNYTVKVLDGSDTVVETTVTFAGIAENWTVTQAPEIAKAGFAWDYAAARTGFNADIGAVRGTAGTNDDADDQSMWAVFNHMESDQNYTFTVTKGANVVFTNTFTADKVNPAYIWSPLDGRNKDCPAMSEGEYTINLYEGGSATGDVVASKDVTVSEYTAPTTAPTVSADKKTITLTLDPKLRGEYKAELFKDGEAVAGKAVEKFLSGEEDIEFTSDTAFEDGTYTIKVSTRYNQNADKSAPVEYFTTKPVTVSSEPATPTLVVTAPVGETDILGKQASALQDSITVSDGYKVTGTSKYVTDYTNFSSNTAQRTGNYLALILKVEVGGTEDNDKKVWIQNSAGTDWKQVTQNDDTVVLLLKDYGTTLKAAISDTKEGIKAENTTTIDISGVHRAAAPGKLSASVATETGLAGKTIADLHSDIAVTEGANDTFTVTGTAKYVSGWTQFSGLEAQRSGHYVALRLSTADGGKIRIVSPAANNTSGEERTAEFTDDVLICRLENGTRRTVSVVTGTEGHETTTTYTLDFTGVTQESATALNVAITPAATELLSKTAEALQSDIAVAKSGTTFDVTGTAKYVTGWTQFSNAQQNGHYVALTLTAPAGATVSINSPSEGNTFKTLDASHISISRLENGTTRTVRVTNGGATQDYTLDFSKVRQVPLAITGVSITDGITANDAVVASYANGTITLSGVLDFASAADKTLTLSVTTSPVTSETYTVKVTKEGMTLDKTELNIAGTKVALASTLEAKKTEAVPATGTSTASSAVPDTKSVAEKTAGTNIANAMNNNKNATKVTDTAVMNAMAAQAANSVTQTKEASVAAASSAITDNENLTTVDVNNNAALKAIVDAAADPEDATKAAAVKQVVQVSMDFKVSDVTMNESNQLVSIKLEITPVARTLVVKADVDIKDPANVKVLDASASNKGDANAVEVGKTNLTTTEPANVSVKLDGVANGTYTVKHTKNGTHYYEGSVSSNTLTFKSLHGFSPFELLMSNPCVAQVGDEMYETMAAAIAAVPNNGTIKLLANITGDVTVSGSENKVFHIDLNGKELAATQIKGTGVEVSAVDSGYNVTYTYVAPEDKPSSGGGGSVSNKVSIGSTTNGKITANNYNPKEGDTVTITATPNDGYVTGTVTVKDAKGNDVTVTKTGDNTFTFTMPKDKVTVNATFVKEDTSTFTDVNDGDYYADAVKWAVEKGITNGLTATTFGPNNSCTRGQMVTFLWRAAGSPAATGTNSFTDVASGEYYYNAVLWAVEKGITNGTSATTFSPNATVNRGQTVTFLYRYAESPAATGDISFTDVAADAFYADAVKWAVAEEITNGTSATTFAPNSNCTRGQIVTFLYRQMAE